MVIFNPFMRQRRDIFTGVVLGSDVVQVAVASFETRDDPASMLLVRGYARVPSLKIRRDEPETTAIVVEQLARALDEAWGEADCEGLPGNLCLCISGGYVHREIVSSTLELKEQRVITEEDVNEVMRRICQEEADWQPEGGKAMICGGIPLINRGFRLADGRLRLNAAGQVSTSITAESFLFSEETEGHGKIDVVMREALPVDCAVDQVVYAPIALSSGIFQPSVADEASGLVVDLGAGMTSYVILSHYGAVACGQIPVGMDHVVNDLGIALGVQMETARTLVKDLESLRCSLDVKQDGTARTLTIKEHVGEQTRDLVVYGAAVEMVMEARLREIFQLVRKTLEKEGSYLWAGNEIILTGPGAKLPQICLLAEKVFTERKVRIGTPYRARRMDGAPLGPEDAIMMGLLRASCLETQLQALEAEEAEQSGFLGKLKAFWKSVRDW